MEGLNKRQRLSKSEIIAKEIFDLSRSAQAGVSRKDWRSDA